jgi:hypothetical protein
MLDFHNQLLFCIKMMNLFEIYNQAINIGTTKKDVVHA